MKLSDLKPGERARVIRVSSTVQYSRRLMEMGFLPGVGIEVLYEAPWGSDPIAVNVRGGVIALRRVEASQIDVEVETVEGAI